MKNHKLFLIGVYLLLGVCALPALAQKQARDFSFPVPGGRVRTNGCSVEKVDAPTGAQVRIRMECLFDSLQVSSNRFVVIRPVLRARGNGQQQLAFAPWVVAGRCQYLLYQRNGRLEPDYADAPVLSLQEVRRNGYAYRDEAAWQPWMEGAELCFACDLAHCCDSREQPLVAVGYRLPVDLVKRLAYALPPVVKETKTFQLHGTAFVNFAVNQTDIRPDYMNNPRELRKITDTLDVMVADPNVTVERIRIHGYASPESPYVHNRDLARGRAAALTDYIQHRYSLPATVYADPLATAENWVGLYKEVENGGLPHRAELLELITRALRIPDAQGEQCDRIEWQIKSSYPAEYRQLLAEAYPRLRRSDYDVTSVVKRFAVDEAKEVMKSHPAYLSAEELAALAGTYPMGSDEYRNVFLLADRHIGLLKEEGTISRSRLLMATAALKRGDAETAARYLEGAGDSPQAQNARGAWFVLQGDYAEARRAFARCEGQEEAERNLRLLDEIE